MKIKMIALAAIVITCTGCASTNNVVPAGVTKGIESEGGFRYETMETATFAFSAPASKDAKALAFCLQESIGNTTSNAYTVTEGKVITYVDLKNSHVKAQGVTTSYVSLGMLTTDILVKFKVDAQNKNSETTVKFHTIQRSDNQLHTTFRTQWLGDTSGADETYAALSSINSTIRSCMSASADTYDAIKAAESYK